MEGNDEIHGGPGKDFLLSEGGNDLLDGGTGDDFIDAKDPSSNSTDIVKGGHGRGEIEQRTEKRTR